MGKCSCNQIVKFFFMRSIEGAIIVVLLLLLPGVPPYSSFKESYKVVKTLPFEGKLALNNKLDNVEVLFNGTIDGPERFISVRGMLFTGTNDGLILRVDKNLSPYRKLGEKCDHFDVTKCGRPLGMDVDADGNIIVADAHLGIWKLDPHQSHLLVNPKVEIDGEKPMLINSVAVASNGDIYWTDSSSFFALEDGLFDLLSDPSGRLIKYDSKTKTNRVLMKNLHFANGLALTKKEDAVIVAETGRNALHKYDLKKGTSQVLIEGLPGMPDNLHNDGNGNLLVPLVSSHDAQNPNILQIFGPFPWIRKFAARVLGLTELAFKMIDKNVYPNDYCKIAVHYIGHLGIVRFMPIPKRTTILHISEDGQILNSWHSQNDKLHFISDAYIFKDHLYLGSPWNNYIGRIPVQQLGLKPQVEKVVTPKVQATTTTAAPPTPKPTPAAKPKETVAKKQQETVKQTAPKKEAPKPAKEAPKFQQKESKPVKQTAEVKKEAPKVESPKPAQKKTPEVKATQEPKPKPTPQPKQEAPKVKTSNDIPNAANKKSDASKSKESTSQGPK